MADIEKHLRLSKAAELLGVSTQTLRTWDTAGKIKTVRTQGNQRRIPESEVMRLLAVNINGVDTCNINRETPLSQ